MKFGDIDNGLIVLIGDNVCNIGGDIGGIDDFNFVFFVVFFPFFIFVTVFSPFLPSCFISVFSTFILPFTFFDTI